MMTMAWEVEHHHLDKTQAMHRFTLVNHAVKDQNGHSQRQKFYIQIGTGADGCSCSHCGQALPGGFVLDHQGILRDADLNEVNPHALVKEHIQKLNTHHARMDAYAKRHNVPHMTGQK